MEPQIKRCSRDLTFNLMQKAKDGHKVNVKEYFGAYTLDVIASTAFGLQVDSQKDLTEPFLVNVKAMLGGVRTFHFFNALLAVLPFLAPAVRWLRSFSKPAAFYTDSIRSMVQQRKGRDGNDRSTPVDFLQLLVNAEDTENTIESHKRLTLEEVESQMILFFVAGYETTGSTLQYLAYSLAMHPDIQERVVAEIQQELGEETPTYDNVSKLKYMDHAIHETLRLYPPVSQVTREASETMTIKGLTIPRGFGVLVPVQIVMRDPDYFPDPARFNPDRFSDKGSTDPISFLAFGQGPRQCVGMRLAMLEIKVAMVHVLRQIRFVRTPDMPETLQFKAGVGSLQYLTAPLLVKVVPRNADQ
ncbi:cytochrome P450 3A29-like [Babylonia areolata]|uniref:cytochrome P450 3A29-like n=1 Tax=Babylonia areolata TaxID=304850 RepID=UPI003FD11384